LQTEDAVNDDLNDDLNEQTPTHQPDPSEGAEVPVIDGAAEQELARAERFYSRLRRRVSRWFERRGRVAAGVAPVLLLLPDLFALLLRLIRDPQVAGRAKVSLLAVTAYVVSPFDLVPDFLLPWGLIDDAVAAALVLSQVVRLMDAAGEEALRRHWEGSGDALMAIQRVLGAADELLGRRVLKRLRRRFRPEAR
jgi:uncharacterized membrane protein YkvA (DUF1232 family)